MGRPNTSPSVTICGSPSSIWIPSCVSWHQGFPALCPLKIALLLGWPLLSLVREGEVTESDSDCLLPGYSHSLRPGRSPGCPKRHFLSIHLPLACDVRVPSSQESLSRLACGTSKPVRKSSTSHVAVHLAAHGRSGPNITRRPGQEHTQYSVCRRWTCSRLQAKAGKPCAR